jgi:hypothetical protein
MSITDNHRKIAVIVKLDDFATTKSNGGVVIFKEILPHSNYWGIDLNNEKAWPSPLLPYLNSNKTDIDTSKYKLMWIENNSSLSNKVQLGWILDAETGYYLRDPNK